ncbi:MAG: Spx/MgsR family RNA polymerase-binding regulatory protein [Bacteroidetes bacterium]|nr:MAG: Spx/MgsR family RNA polymerase-binding regulatory protein [Bacteroidota bacterium]
MIHVYGIPNCDTVSKSLKWLQAQQAEFVFHNFKVEGPSLEKLHHWEAAVSWQRLLNKQSSTWRQLLPHQQLAVKDANSAVLVMQAQNSAIKRPVVEWPNGDITVGFVATDWEKLLP